PLQVPGIHKKTSSINDFKPITIINLTCYTFGSIVGSIIVHQKQKSLPS
ncbi:MAG: hypothetical protein ACI9NN_001446, partial [Bacteroidia bacterium]